MVGKKLLIDFYFYDFNITLLVLKILNEGADTTFLTPLTKIPSSE